MFVAIDDDSRLQNHECFHRFVSFRLEPDVYVAGFLFPETFAVQFIVH